MTNSDGDKAAEITWPYVHTFGRPVEVLKDRETSIMLREPTVKDLLQHGVLDGTMNAEQMIGLIADLSDWPPPKIQALPGVEGMRLSAVLSRFFSSAAR
ncbi:phage tail assembly protein [Chelatococcus reniformis]|uniref:Phage tail assembly protein n=1 Tax=Chelatococcus reniformis TaxID=1494448 RepID=A0A916UVC4_9HYPH|nr:phage tail assembly protein [Chelatococcus reniformis]GGC90356.1 hypothetical protein GCM10010994_55220 [Chelatococcus reniformis]